MTKTMRDWFFMRDGFERFRLVPERHSRYLFGKDDRQKRDQLLTSLEEACYSQDGYKAAFYGDYGRGKTHQCHNLIYEVARRNIGVLPVYVKCGAFKKKEPFSSLFRELVGRHKTEDLKRVASEYLTKTQQRSVAPLVDIVNSKDVADVMTSGLTTPNPEVVRTSQRWLGGEAKVNIHSVAPGLKAQLTDSGDFGAVIRGISHMFVTVDGTVPLYIVDEAERFENVTDTDTFYIWLAAMRELTEIHGVGMLFMIGARNRDDLPTLFVQSEIIRRIGTSNYMEFLNPGKEDLREFLLEQMQTTIRKGPVPDSQADIVEAGARDETIPQELLTITEGDEERLRTYPFQPDAFDEFVTQLVSGEYANKPSETQIRLQKAAQRAMRLDARTIDTAIVQQIENDAA